MTIDMTLLKGNLNYLVAEKTLQKVKELEIMVSNVDRTERKNIKDKKGYLQSEVMKHIFFMLKDFGVMTEKYFSGLTIDEKDFIKLVAEEMKKSQIGD